MAKKTEDKVELKPKGEDTKPHDENMKRDL